jgi:hypothetical protein
MGNVDGDYDEFSAGETVDLSCSFSILRGEWFNSSSKLKVWIFERFCEFMM